MISIPKQLQNEGFRFTRVKANGKIPIDRDWTRNNNFAFDSPELKTHLENGGNYGVLCGAGGLAVVDYDNPKLFEALNGRLPSTFRVKTSKGYHDYFLVDKPIKKQTLLFGGDQAGDLLGNKSQVIGPGSRHPSGATYEVVRDKPITRITAPTLFAALQPFLNDRKDRKQREPREKKPLDKFKAQIDLREAAKRYLPKWDGEGNARCPWHDDKEPSLTVNRDYAYCHSCRKSFDVLNFMEKFEGTQTLPEQVRRATQIFEVETPEEFKKKTEGKLDFENLGYQDLARALIRQNPVFYDEHKIWWIWGINEKRWVMADKVGVLTLFSHELKRHGREDWTCKPGKMNALLNAIQQQSRVAAPKPPESHWLQFGGTAYDLTSEEAVEVTPEYFWTSPIPWEPGESEKTPELDKLFAEWVVAQELGHHQAEITWVQTLYDCIAYACLPEQTRQTAIALLGNGANGKTKFLEVLTKFIGKENITTTDFQALNSRFGTASLYGKRACVFSEAHGEAFERNPRAENEFKRLTGDATITYEFKGKDPFNALSTATPFVPTNHLPRPRNPGRAFYRRWIIVDFPNQFSINPDLLKRIPEHEYNNLARKIIRIARELWRGRKITNEGTFEEKKSRFVTRADYGLSKFIELCCEVGDGYKTPNQEFYEHFKTWVTNGDPNHELANLSNRKIAGVLNSEVLANGRHTIESRKDSQGRGRRYVLDLRLKNEEPVTRRDPGQTPLADTHPEAKQENEVWNSRLNQTKKQLHDLLLGQQETTLNECRAACPEDTQTVETLINRALENGGLNEVRPNTYANYGGCFR